MSAGYLFQPDKHYEISLDTGDKTIQCGRHVDILKLWLAWKARGHQGYAEHIELLVDRARFLYETVRGRSPYFRVLMEVNRIDHLMNLRSVSFLFQPPFINVCFWYVPESLQKIDSNSSEYYERLDKVR